MSDTAKDIETWLDDCDEVRNIDPHRGGPDFTSWELDFLDSVREQFDERGTLTEAQTDKLKTIWDKI